VLVQLRNATFHLKANNRRTDPHSKLVLELAAIHIYGRAEPGTFSINAHGFELRCTPRKREVPMYMIPRHSDECPIQKIMITSVFH
jgi:hypothetical protein